VESASLCIVVPPDDPSMNDRGWHERASLYSLAVAPLAQPSARSLPPDGELAGIVRRAAAIGVPAWRVTTALGLPLPVDRD
jgi:hypothetical protein